MRDPRTVIFILLVPVQKVNKADPKRRPKSGNIALPLCAWDLSSSPTAFVNSQRLELSPWVAWSLWVWGSLCKTGVQSDD